MAKPRDQSPASIRVGLAFCCLVAIVLSAGCQKATSPTRSLDQLDAAQIPPDLQFPNQPPGMVAVFTSKVGDAGLGGIAISPDRTRLACGFGSGDLVVWNTGTDPRVEFAATRAHNNRPISAILFSPDGKILIDGCYDHTARLWDVGENGLRERATLDGHFDQIWGMSLSHDGKTLATASFDKTVRIWNIGDTPPKQIAVIDNQQPVWGVSIARDGQTLACTCGDNIALWDIGGEKPKRTATLTAHKNSVWRVVFSPTGQMLASTGSDKTVRLWDTGGTQPRERVSLTGHDTTEIYGLTFSPDGKRLVSTDYKGRVIHWDASAGTERNRWQMPDGLRVAVFASDGRHVAMSCDNQRAYLLRLPD
jgi:WD40 repeat protein